MKLEKGKFYKNKDTKEKVYVCGEATTLMSGNVLVAEHATKFGYTGKLVMFNPAADYSFLWEEINEQLFRYFLKP